jgi:hypothetical protein
MPDNNCVPASDYTGYVADTVNLLLSQCSGNPAAPVGVGCRATDCSGAGTTTACTTCDVANNFYLLNGVCYAYASIPDGYGIVTAGQQPLAACTDTNCLKCVRLQLGNQSVRALQCPPIARNVPQTKQFVPSVKLPSGLPQHRKRIFVRVFPTVTDTYGFNSVQLSSSPAQTPTARSVPQTRPSAPSVKLPPGFYMNIGNRLCARLCPR